MDVGGGSEEVARQPEAASAPAGDVAGAGAGVLLDEATVLLAAVLEEFPLRFPRRLLLRRVDRGPPVCSSNLALMAADLVASAETIRPMEARNGQPIFQ